MNDSTNNDEKTDNLKTNSRSFISIFTIIISFVALISVAYLFYSQKTLQHSQSNLQSTEQESQSNIQNNFDDLKTEIKNINERNTQQSEDLQSYNQRIKAILTKEQSSQSWQLQEVNYLVELADYQLRFQHNISVAISLLNAANKRVLSLGDPSLIPLRTALNKDITSLNTYPKYDVISLYTQLASLNKQVKIAPLAPSLNPLPETKPKENISRWRAALDHTWQELQKIIIIHHDKDVMKHLTPTEKQLLIQNMRVMIANAQWAILHRNNKIYQTNLEEMQSLLSLYQFTSAQDKKAMVNNIKSLQETNIGFETPPELLSSAAIHNILSQNKLENKEG